MGSTGCVNNFADGGGWRLLEDRLLRLGPLLIRAGTTIQGGRLFPPCLTKAHPAAAGKARSTVVATARGLQGAT
jgi:hypothetical protein